MANKHIANTLKISLREGYIPARFGGEEFCILCINLNDENSAILFERIRVAIESEPVITPEEEIVITASIGYCTIVENKLDPMISHADKALYQAKNSGRNQVVSYQPD